MILKASQRAGARPLAKHLLNERDNDHVEVHELRGFVSDRLQGALLETEAAAKATKCKQSLFSVSLSPPASANVREDVFEKAADRIEADLGLEGQPRAIVFHEKDGRRHAHCVWSRIDAGKMRAINLSFYKKKLNEVSRQLFINNGWELPNGFKRAGERSPLNFTLAEWQQAKRAGKDAAKIKAAFQECWNTAGDRSSLKSSLEERGYFLARGDRRGYVAVDHQGEVYALGRMTGARAKQIKERLGDPGDMPGVEEIRQRVARLYEQTLKRHIHELNRAAAAELAPLQQQKRALVAGQREARATLRSNQRTRWTREAAARQERFSKGLRGVWDWLRGRHKALRRQNEMEIVYKRDRDRQERQTLIQEQLNERRKLQREIGRAQTRHANDLERLYRDLARTQLLRYEESEQDGASRQGVRASSRARGERTGRKERGRSRERGLEP